MPRLEYFVASTSRFPRVPRSTGPTGDRCRELPIASCPAFGLFSRSARRLIVRASTRIDRTAFGLTAARGMAGRHLDVSLRILAVRR